MKQIKVVCGACIYKDKVLIARRSYGSAKGFYEFPGGKAEPGETLEEALKREWMEECHLEIFDIEKLCSHTDYQDETEIQLEAFTCRCRTDTIQPSAHNDFIWCSPWKIYDYNFFKQDEKIVNALIKRWPQLVKKGDRL